MSETLRQCGHKQTDVDLVVEPKCYGIDEEQNAAENLMGCLKARKEGGGFQGAVAYDMTHGDDPMRQTGDKVNTLQSRMGTGGNQVPVVAMPVAFDCKQSGGDAVHDGTSPTLRSLNSVNSNISGGGHCAVAMPVAQVQWASGGGQVHNPTAQALRSGAEHNYQFAQVGMQVRRLTPTECERLQGFPDNWTAGFSDSTRYKMLGNAVCVNVSEWIARRLMRHIQDNLTSPSRSTPDSTTNPLLDTTKG